MKWLAMVGEAINRIPFEKFLIKPRDKQEDLKELREILQAPESQNKPSSRASMPSNTEEVEETAILEPRRPPKVHLAPSPTTGVSSEVTVEYQNREIGKLLLRMERHYAQRLRINGVPCDCGSQKHLLDLESLCEETIPMVDNPQVYYSVIDWIREVGPKSTDESAKSGLYDEEYPAFSHQARDFRKELLGTLDPKALFPKRLEERGGTSIFPIMAEEERGQIEGA